MEEEDQLIEVTVTLTRQELEELERAAWDKESDIEQLAARIILAWLKLVYRLYQQA